MQLFVNDLTVMDFSYLCPERGMVGESWIVDVVLNGSLNEESMVLDFGRVKKDLKALIDEYVDHKLLVPVDHSYTKIENQTDTGNVLVAFQRPGAGIYLDCPPEAYALIYDEQITMDSVSAYLRDVLAIHLPDNVAQISLHLRAEVINTPYYHYTHGLKKHDGNCQRIAHGHRSKVDVLVAGQLDLTWQQYWAERWRDIYIGSHQDLVTLEELSTGMQQQSIDPEQVYLFSYEASQGQFQLAIPQSETELIDTDSTVECLAQYMADECKALKPQQDIEIRAYEGVGKGAIAYA